MAQAKVLLVVLLAALVLSMDVMEVGGEEDGGRCCNNHPSLGRCLPGIDDNPSSNGKCWAFCISGCVKGGFCKRMKDGHHECHCYC
ncbi:putative defensin-like protein 20 [Corchorus olitorius]|uniref:Defensin-like protein 20 n=1 Tax=Corchorus olitorius TaxID=93759 RepID=A0A1R3HCK7_9ROSI|nr:putative defensin-like protein 20 [Corchorus olitorius]